MQENNSKKKRIVILRIFYICFRGLYIKQPKRLEYNFAEMKPPGTPPLATPLKVITQLPVGPCQ